MKVLSCGFLKMHAKPLRSELGDLVERSGLFEEMRRVWNDRQVLLADKLFVSALVQLDDDVVRSADDEQRRRSDIGKRFIGEVRPAAARDHGADASLKLRCGDESGGAACARAEVTDARLTQPTFAIDPLRRISEPLG